MRILIALLSACLILLPAPLTAVEETSAGRMDFSLAPTQEWMELPLPLQGVIVSYGKKGTLATFHITERDLDSVKKVEDLHWKDLFSPQFEAIDIRQEGETLIGGEKARYCIYSLKPGPFKTQMEGKLPAKYMNYVLIRGGKLYSITYKDTEDGFSLNYPSFLAVIRTLRFNHPAGKTA